MKMFCWISLSMTSAMQFQNSAMLFWLSGMCSLTCTLMLSTSTNVFLKMKKQGFKKSNKLSSMSFDDFVKNIADSENNAKPEMNGRVSENGVKSQRKGSQINQVEEDSDVDESEEEHESGDEGATDESSGNDVENSANDVDQEDEESSDDERHAGTHAGKKHKQDLSKLKDIDPEFYKYLEENDKKLLQFDVSDSDESLEEDASHNISKSEVSSDSEAESDGAEDSGAPHGSVVTMKMVSMWREKLVTDRSIQAINEVVQAFHAALQRVLPEDQQDGCPFKVVGGAVFNAIVQMCVLDLLPALCKYLKLPSKSWTHTQLQKSKHWVKVRSLVKSYLVDLLQLIEGVTSVNVTTILLKHLHQMCSFVPCFPTVAKKLLKKTITLWSSGEETVRVLAFMCALKVTTSQQQTYLDSTLRYMYMAYINNTKFVSPSTLSGINFMRKSLAEMFLLDENVSYHHAFLYIRQLAIHLRNAINLQKKETIQAVYNWQFMASLSLWVELLSQCNKPVLQPLVYPVVQVITGALKLIPTAQYYPLRFHCVRMLIDLSKNTGTFVPTLPFLLEVLNTYDFNKKHAKVSMKPLDISCILRVSKIQQQENGFKDAVVESIYTLLLQYATAVSHSVAFPDLMVPTIVQLKSFLKKCKIPNYTKKMKQILDKIEANCRFIEKERKGSEINLTDSDAVENWETSIKVKGTPLVTFYSSWEKMNNLKEINNQTGTINISGKDLQVKAKVNKKGEKVKTDHPPSDSEPGTVSKPKSSKPGKHGQRSQSEPAKKIVRKSGHLVGSDDEDMEDVVEDASITDW